LLAGIAHRLAVRATCARFHHLVGEQLLGRLLALLEREVVAAVGIDATRHVLLKNTHDYGPNAGFDCGASPLQLGTAHLAEQVGRLR
jgi:hypothetical protein